MINPLVPLERAKAAATGALDDVGNNEGSIPSQGSTIAALFVRKDSIYKSIPRVDAWDEERDARNWPGGQSLIAHPPCAQWGTLSHMSNHNPAEKELAVLAVGLIRRWGGVLEHPVRSKLWKEMKLPKYPLFDRWGGWTLTVSQRWWGHRAEKRTNLYIVGCRPVDLPPMPIVLGEATHIVAGGAPRDAEHAKRKHKAWPCLPSITAAEREQTPPAFAKWLVELANRCSARAKAVQP